MKKRTKISLVLSSAAAILLAGSIMAGGTYALFTSESKTNIAVSSGTVKINASIEELKTYSGEANSLTGDVEVDNDHIVQNESTTFLNGGTASIDGSKLTLTHMTPGDKVTFNINIENTSTVAAKYRTVVSLDDDNGLFSGLEIKVKSKEFIGTKAWSSYSALGAEEISIPVEVSLPSDRGNDYQNASCDLSFVVEAIQGNASDGVYEVNTENAQSIIDSIEGDATIVLSSGNYDTLYLRQNPTKSTRISDYDKEPTYPAYYREIKNLKITVAEGAQVTCKGIKVEAGLYHQTTAPASNSNEMNNFNGVSGFVSYLSLENIVIDGITFNESSNCAVLLKENTQTDSSSDLYVNNFVVKNCKGTGNNFDNIHFFNAGSGARDINFLSTGKKGLNNIYLVNNEINSYKQAVAFNNNVATLNGFTIKNNKFTDITDNTLQISNLVNTGEFIFDGNTLTNMNGRFARINSSGSTGAAIIRIRNNVVITPKNYDSGDVGQIFKVTASAAGFKIHCSEKDWSVVTNTETVWVANGDTTLIPSE